MKECKQTELKEMEENARKEAREKEFELLERSDGPQEEGRVTKPEMKNRRGKPHCAEGTSKHFAQDERKPVKTRLYRASCRFAWRR
jgi:hypothetical protein